MRRGVGGEEEEACVMSERRRDSMEESDQDRAVHQLFPVFSLSPTTPTPIRGGGRWEAEGDLGGGGRYGRRWAIWEEVGSSGCSSAVCPGG